MKTKVLKKSRIPEQATSEIFMSLAAMKKGWTPVTNAWLRAMMGEEQPAGYRVLAWLVLYSWGLSIKSEYALFEGRKARQSDIAGKNTGLDMSKQQVNNIINRLAEEGWIRIEDLCYYPLMEPKTRDVRHKIDPAAELDYWITQTREAYTDAVPRIAALKARAYESMNEYRSEKGKEAKEVFDKLPESARLKLVAEYRAKIEADEAASKKYTAQESAPETAQCTESTPREVQTPPFLIKEGKKDKPLSSSSVLEALAHYGHPDDDAAEKLLRECRKIAPDVTPEEVAQAIHAKGSITAKARNPIGLLLTAVPNALPGILRKLRAAPPVLEEEQLEEAPERTLEEKIESVKSALEIETNPRLRPIWEAKLKELELEREREEHYKSKAGGAAS